MKVIQLNFIRAMPQPWRFPTRENSVQPPSPTKSYISSTKYRIFMLGSWFCAFYGRFDEFLEVTHDSFFRGNNGNDTHGNTFCFGRKWMFLSLWFRKEMSFPSWMKQRWFSLDSRKVSPFVYSKCTSVHHTEKPYDRPIPGLDRLV